METGTTYKHACRICFEERDKGLLIFSEEGKKMYLQTKIRKYLYITVRYFFWGEGGLFVEDFNG